MGVGLHADRDRPGWDEELRGLRSAIERMPPGRVLDVACGTDFLTRHLKGEVVGMDQSECMAEIAAERAPEGHFVVGDALSLPFEDGSFDRVFTGHFYGHLRPREREAFIGEARRVARELVVVDSALREDVEPEEVQERVLSDGPRHEVYKRYSTDEGLVEELGGGRILFSGMWFVMVAS